MKCIDFLHWIRKSNWKKAGEKRYELGLYRTIAYTADGIEYFVHGVDFTRDTFAYEELSIDKTGSIIADDGTIIPVM